MIIDASTGVAALISAALVWPLRRSRLRWPGAVVIPIAVAYFTYWIPAWSSGRDTAQYAVWAPVGIAVLCVPAVVFTTAIIVSSAWRRRGSAAGTSPNAGS